MVTADKRLGIGGPLGVAMLCAGNMLAELYKYCSNYSNTPQLPTSSSFHCWQSTSSGVCSPCCQPGLTATAVHPPHIVATRIMHTVRLYRPTTQSTSPYKWTAHWSLHWQALHNQTTSQHQTAEQTKSWAAWSIILLWWESNLEQLLQTARATIIGLEEFQSQIQSNTIFTFRQQGTHHSKNRKDRRQTKTETNLQQYYAP